MLIAMVIGVVMLAILVPIAIAGVLVVWLQTSPGPVMGPEPGFGLRVGSHTD